jgi:hypothetical protein
MCRAGFENADMDIWNLGEAGSQAQSCGASTDDNEVILMLEEVTIEHSAGRIVSAMMER